MPDPRDIIEAFRAFRARHSRTFGGVHQVLLCMVAFECAVAIARFGPAQVPGGSTGGVNGSNSTTEPMCKYGAREEDVDVGPLAAILPYLILCPSTLTLISSCIIFVWGMAKLNYLNRDDVWLEDAIPFVFFSTVFSMEWKRIFVSLQMYLPISIWIASAVSAAFHPFFRCAFPGTYRKAKEAKAAQREEARRKWEERRAKKRQGDAEAGTLGEQSEVGRLGGVVGGVTEESPLMGTGGGAPEISGLPPSGA